MQSLLRRQHTVRPLNALEGETLHRTVVPRPLPRPGLCGHLRTSQQRWRHAENFPVFARPVQERGVVEQRVSLAGGEVVGGREVCVGVDGVGGRVCGALVHALRTNIFAPTRGVPCNGMERRYVCMYVCTYVCMCPRHQLDPPP